LPRLEPSRSRNEAGCNAAGFFATVFDESSFAQRSIFSGFARRREISCAGIFVHRAFITNPLHRAEGWEPDAAMFVVGGAMETREEVFYD
jgi:hypothetical protein